MKIFWIVQKDLLHDLDSATWIEPSKILKENGSQVVLIYSAQKKSLFRNQFLEDNSRAIKVINFFPFLSISFHIQIFFRMLFWLFSEKPNVVITHPITALFIVPAIILSKLAGLKCKFVLDIRTLPVGSFGISGKIKKRIINLSIFAGNLFFDGVTVITPALKRVIIERFKIRSEKIGIWGSGVNMDLFQPEKRKDAFPNKAFTILYHGVIAENRGILETAQAMEIISKNYADIQLKIIGTGPGRDKLEKFIRDRKLQNCVKLLPPVPQAEIPGYVQTANCGILPLPDYEYWRISSPLKLFEYLAMSKPVLASQIEAHSSVLKNCPAGIFISSVSPEGIADAIIATNLKRSQLKDWGEAGRKLVMHNYTWQHQTEKLEKYLNNLT